MPKKKNLNVALRAAKKSGTSKISKTTSRPSMVSRVMKVIRHLTPLERELRKNDFRVAIFGSARTQTNDKVWKQVYNLAKMIGHEGWDMVTGGGPGLMEAANAGHEAGDGKKRSDNIGLVIKLPWEAAGNKHLEIKKKFNRFSSRLDTFMALSSAVVVMPGGVGTCLELFYSWQLVQVKHIRPIPIILVGDMWKQLITWVKKYPLKQGLVSPHEMECIHIAKNNKEAMEIIKKTHRHFVRGGNHTNKDYL